MLPNFIDTTQAQQPSPPAPTLTLTFNIDDIINRLISGRAHLWEQEIKFLIDVAREIFMHEDSLLCFDAPVTICGDLHGQFKDLLRIFQSAGYPSQLNKYLFLGDYVDRGQQSTQCICLLIAYKIKYPYHFYLLRGNHECASLNKAYGFFNECSQRYSVKLWKSFVECFNYMPPAALVSGTILCMHGGLSHHMTELRQISETIQRPCDIDTKGLLCDLLWADPDNSCQLFGESTRGAGYVFGKEVVDLFCELNNIQLIVRAHQIVQDGYQFSFNQKLITIFSAPNYCNKFCNDGGILKVSANLECSILRLPPKIMNIKKFTINIQDFQKHQAEHKNQVVQTNSNSKDLEEEKSIPINVDEYKTKRIQKKKQLARKIKQAKAERFRSRSLQKSQNSLINPKQCIDIDRDDKESQEMLNFVIEIKNWNESMINENQKLKKIARRKSEYNIPIPENRQVFEVAEDDDNQSIYIDLSNDDEQKMDIE